MANNIVVNSKNKDVDYVVADFSSSIDAIISYATVNYGAGTSANRLWTNFSTDSFSRTWAEVVAYVADIFFFYLDNKATQNYLQTATVRSAVNNIAKQFGFTPASATSSSGVAIFTVNGAGVIPRGFRVSATNGQEFFVTNAITAVAAGDVSGNVLQGSIVVEQFSAEGLQNEEFNLRGPNIIRDLSNSNPLDISPQVVVNGNNYTLVSSFIRHNGEDSDAITDSLGNVIGGGGRVFVLEERPNGTSFIRFGDGVFGKKLAPGETVSITYRTGGGTAGNIGAETLTTLVDSSSIVTSVSNDSDFSGGADEQTIEQLRELIPASLRTLDRAVAEKDYSDILLTNFPEVFAASTEVNNVDVGIDLNIYVVPQGSGIAQISDNIILKNKLSDYIDRRKMVTVQFQILDAFGIDTLIDLEIFLTDTASKTAVRSAINTALQDFFDLSTGGPNKTGIGFAENILLKDIGNVIETIQGITRFEIKKLSYRPRLAPNIIGLLTEYNFTPVTIYKNVSESEWLVAASGQQAETTGTVIFDNIALTGFNYNSSTGEITYNFPVDLLEVAPGDLFRDGSNTDFTILAVDTANSILILSESLTINNTVTTSDHGSVRNAGTIFESFRVFKKVKAKTSNLSVDYISDTNIDFSIHTGTANAISSRVLLDNDNVFIPLQYSTGQFYLVDSQSNIWEIVENDSNTIKTSITAVNDASVTNVASGEYRIVKKLVGQQIVFNDNIFNIQYNSHNTFYSIGSQFSQIGTIGDGFDISDVQSNIGRLGTALDLISYDSGNGELKLNNAPDLQGVNSNYVLIDSSGQLFNVTGVDNRAKPSIIYDSSNQNTNFVLEGAGLGSQVAQGFQVTDNSTYAVVSCNLKREGNVVGNLTMKIVDDDGSGLPDLGSPIATSEPLNIATISDTTFQKTLFSFVTPPSLTTSTQYHLVLSPDASYVSSMQDGIIAFNNTGLEGFSYNSLSGVISYSGAVNLSNVEPGHYFQDGANNLFKILAVDDSIDEVTIATGQTINNIVTTSDHGSIVVQDRILVGIDTTSPTYADGEFSRFDGSLWSDSTQGPSPSGTNTDMIFSVEGTKTINIESNLTPVLGPGATVTTRYYDDEFELSFVLGHSAGTITSATDVKATGKGTVSGDPNRRVDFFVFRTSSFADDIVNLRLNEIPRIKLSDIKLDMFNGID